jgi:acyl-[acyl-carrier-protein] desaturase
MIFYRNLLAAAFERDPSMTMRAVADIVQNFQMPGHSIEGFTRKSVQIANAGIYDLRQHRDQVLVPILRQWKVWDIEGLDAEGEKARFELDEFLAGLETAAGRFEQRRDERAARVAARI